MRTPSVKVAVATCLVTLSLIPGAVLARANADVRPPAEISIRPLDPISVGEKATIVARLHSPTGVPIPDERLVLYLDGVQERRVRTDLSGSATFKIRRDLEAGTYRLLIVYDGSSAWPPASAAALLVVRPITFEVHTVPPMAGIAFAWDGNRFTSGPDGIARIQVSRIGTYRLEFLAPADGLADVQVEFERWEDEVFKTAREVHIPHTTMHEAGLAVSYRVRQSFVDLRGQPVDPDRITELTIRSSHGGVVSSGDGGWQWLQAGRVIRRRTGLEETTFLYSVESVIVDGANVVNRGQQRFLVRPDDVWQVELLLFSARLTARDALFRFPVGSGVDLRYPDGSVEYWPFGPAGEVTVQSLARGLYRVQVAGAAGIAPPTPVALSRDQDVQLLVISYLDIAVVTLAGTTFALGLLLVGRPHLVRALRRPAVRGARSRDLA